MAIVDCDVHPFARDGVVPLLSERWRRHLSLVGARPTRYAGIATARPFASRLDAVPPDGGPPGSDPEFAREQLLDEYGIAAAILIPYAGLGGANTPVAFEADVSRATNDYVADSWLDADPRWLSSISIPINQPAEAVREIVRCRERSDRYVQILGEPVAERPHGNPKYWPIYEAAVAYDIPVAFHIGASALYHTSTGVGESSFYYERAISAGYAQSLVTSLVFEGVFDRWPTLKVVLVEMGWSWIVPLTWRLDSTWRVMREEVPHLQRKPSDYVRDQVWYTTQPAVETERPAQQYQLFDQLERAGLMSRLLFASDYPHWDMDSPFETILQRLPGETKQKLLAGNASALYGLDLEQVP